MNSKKISRLLITLSITLLPTSLIGTYVQASPNPNKLALATSVSSNSLSNKSETSYRAKTYVAANGHIAPLKLTFSHIVSPGTITIPNNSINEKVQSNVGLSYTMPYSIINTPLGQAEYLEQGCSDSADPAHQWVSALQSDLDAISSQYPNSNIGSLKVDGVYGKDTASAVDKFQIYVKNGFSCSSMSLDGIAGYQTWTAIYALSNGDNPHQYIN